MGCELGSYFMQTSKQYSEVSERLNDQFDSFSCVEVGNDRLDQCRHQQFVSDLVGCGQTENAEGTMFVFIL